VEASYATLARTMNVGNAGSGASTSTLADGNVYMRSRPVAEEHSTLLSFQLLEDVPANIQAFSHSCCYPGWTAVEKHV
jgi:hypothetical protein